MVELFQKVVELVFNRILRNGDYLKGSKNKII